MTKTSLYLTSALAAGDMAFGLIPPWAHVAGSLLALLVFSISWGRAGGR